MELHKKIQETRIQEICDKYIGDSIKKNKPIKRTDVASLSCSELIALYYNTEWFIERSNDNGVETGLENQIVLMDLIKERVNVSTLYVIHTDATNLPFLTENKSILAYTEKRFADTVACSFNVEYFKESFRFKAIEISENKESYWQKLRATGINTISVDGTKFTIEIDDLVENKTAYDNTEFCRYLVQYAQAIRLGIHRDKLSIFQDAILSKLKENPKIIQGPVIANGENKFKPLYVNASAASEAVYISKLKTENFYAVCKEIFDNKDLTGIVINPSREHIVIPREKISEAFAFLNVKVTDVHKKQDEEQIKKASVQCSKCGKIWQIEKLDTNGVCPVCVQEEQNKRTGTISHAKSKTATTVLRVCKNCGMSLPSEKLSKDGLCPTCVYKAQHIQTAVSTQMQSSERTQITNTVNRANLNGVQGRPQIVSESQKETDYALWCMIWGLLSVILYFTSFISIVFAVKAIKQAKNECRAVSGKVWVGIIASVFNIAMLSLSIFIMLEEL